MLQIPRHVSALGERAGALVRLLDRLSESHRFPNVTTAHAISIPKA
jgi:hypothetical protein